MPESSIIRWRDGGWLVLSGGGDFRQNSEALLEIDTQVLTRTVSQGPLAYLWSANDIETGDAYLEYLAELGGRTAFLVDIATEQDAAMLREISEAGIIVLGEGPQPQRLLSVLHGEVLAAITAAHDNGATIYAQGELAAWLAEWMPMAGFGLGQGVGWLPGAIVAAPYDTAKAEQLQSWLQDTLPTAYGIGLGRGAALALGPDPEGGLEIWGEPNVTVLLGQARP